MSGEGHRPRTVDPKNPALSYGAPITPRDRAASDLDETRIVNGRGQVVTFPRNRYVEAEKRRERDIAAMSLAMNVAAVDVPHFEACVRRGWFRALAAWIGGAP